MAFQRSSCRCRGWRTVLGEPTAPEPRATKTIDLADRARGLLARLLARRWFRFLGRGAALGAVTYLVVLLVNLVDNGTTDWAFPSDTCVHTEVIARGVVDYPEC